MDFYTTKPIEELDSRNFRERLKKRIIISPHVLDHLSERQRKILKKRN